MWRQYCHIVGNKRNYDFSFAEPYQPPIPYPFCYKENMVKQGNAKFMEHKESKEKLEEEVNHSKPPFSTLMIFEVFAITRPPDQTLELIEEKEEESDESNFEKKNHERDKRKDKDTWIKKEPKLKHN
ncbi:unnamed protein product [Lactuca saligna]|uniref:Uncharacterized protein n=1 Tax=Lactuca saligna TaxID=75948 RepID=A0AA35YU76_LACSI|nr:unnamed protein product [Lactuca saligna]